MFGFPFTAREMATHQRGVCTFLGSIDGSVVAGGSGVTDGLSTGLSRHMTVTENGSGDYTFTLNNPGQRFLSIQACSITALANCTAAITVDGTSFTIKQITASTGAALADADFWLNVAVQYATDET